MNVPVRRISTNQRSAHDIDHVLRQSTSLLYLTYDNLTQRLECNVTVGRSRFSVLKDKSFEVPASKSYYRPDLPSQFTILYWLSNCNKRLGGIYNTDSTYGFHRTPRNLF